MKRLALFAAAALLATLVAPGDAHAENDISWKWQKFRRCGLTDNLNQSFMSGHTAIAFAGAGLICAHHRALPLYAGARRTRSPASRP